MLKDKHQNTSDAYAKEQEGYEYIIYLCEKSIPMRIQHWVWLRGPYMYTWLTQQFRSSLFRSVPFSFVSRFINDRFFPYV